MKDSFLYKFATDRITKIPRKTFTKNIRDVLTRFFLSSKFFYFQHQKETIDKLHFFLGLCFSVMSFFSYFYFRKSALYSRIHYLFGFVYSIDLLLKNVRSWIEMRREEENDEILLINVYEFNWSATRRSTAFFSFSIIRITWPNDIWNVPTSTQMRHQTPNSVHYFFFGIWFRIKCARFQAKLKEARTTTKKTIQRFKNTEN